MLNSTPFFCNHPPASPFPLLLLLLLLLLHPSRNNPLFFNSSPSDGLKIVSKRCTSKRLCVVIYTFGVHDIFHRHLLPSFSSRHPSVKILAKTRGESYPPIYPSIHPSLYIVESFLILIEVYVKKMQRCFLSFFFVNNQ